MTSPPSIHRSTFALANLLPLLLRMSTIAVVDSKNVSISGFDVVVMVDESISMKWGHANVVSSKVVNKIAESFRNQIGSEIAKVNFGAQFCLIAHIDCKYNRLLKDNDISQFSGTTSDKMYKNFPACLECVRQLFARQSQDRPERNNIPKVLIVVTDGELKEPYITKPEAPYDQKLDELRNSYNVFVFVLYPDEEVKYGGAAPMKPRIAEMAKLTQNNASYVMNADVDDFKAVMQRTENVGWRVYRDCELISSFTLCKNDASGKCMKVRSWVVSQTQEMPWGEPCEKKTDENVPCNETECKCDVLHLPWKKNCDKLNISCDTTLAVNFTRDKCINDHPECGCWKEFICAGPSCKAQPSEAKTDLYIIGMVAGIVGVVLIAVVVLFVFLVIRRRRRIQKTGTSASFSTMSMASQMSVRPSPPKKKGGHKKEKKGGGKSKSKSPSSANPKSGGPVKSTSQSQQTQSQKPFTTNSRKR